MKTAKTTAEEKPVTNTIEDHKEAARKRAEDCGREIEAVLAKHSCRIQPYLTQQPVGNDGATMIVGAHFGISPQ
jgi:hypothetical protein